MTDAEIVFVFPLPENLTNPKRNGHWAVKAGAKNRYLAVCDTLQLMGALPPTPRTPWVSVRIASVMDMGNAMDDDNAMARHKWPLDWLKTRGYLSDDRRRNIAWQGLPAQRVSRSRKLDSPRAITLTVTPLPPTP